MSDSKVTITKEKNLSLALQYHRACSFDKARKMYRKVLEKQPEHTQALVNFGILEHQCGNSKQGLIYINKGIAIQPDNTIYLYNKGKVLEEIDNYQDAIKCYQRVIELQPDDAATYHLLGNCLLQLGQDEMAIQNYHRVLMLNPNYTHTYLSLGKAYIYQGEFKRAVQCFEKALQINPNSAIAYEYLGDLFKRFKNYTQAINNLKCAIKLNSQRSYSIISLANCFLETCNWQNIDTTLRRINEITFKELSQGKVTQISPFTSLSLPWYAKRHLAFAKNHAKNISRPMQKIAKELNFTFTRTLNSRLRIGYLSADFRNHTVGQLIQGLFSAHNRQEFEVFAYSCGENDNSDYRNRIAREAEHFIDVQQQSFKENAKQIFNDGIHLLIDLTGYTIAGRPKVMALRPAPIQVNYLGFLGTLGADFIDYIITDEIVTPPETERYYTEKFVYMPHTYQINSHQQHSIGETPTRKACGLPEDAFVFCCFNNNYKIDPTIFHVWLTILKKQTHTVLWLLKESEEVVRNLKEEAERYGVHPERIIFAEKKPNAQHWARHRVADLYLDTTIANARTSAGDALWTGLPILTCPGKNFCNRVSASLLTAIGLPELIMRSLEEYQKTAIYFAEHPEKIRVLKDKLAANIKTHPLFDTEKFTKDLEHAYKKMWDIYSQGLPCQKIHV